MKRGIKRKGKGKWVFIAESDMTPEEIEKQRFESVSEQIEIQCAMTPDMGGRFNAASQLQDYFPGTNEVPEGGAWVLVKESPPTEYTVPPLSLWFAEPWPMNDRYGAHRVKIVTPRGTLGLFPHEYSLVTEPQKYYEFFGSGMTLKFFSSDEGVPKDALFYLRSRGISKKDALALLIGDIKAPGVLWVESDPETLAAFGMKLPDPEMNAAL